MICPRCGNEWDANKSPCTRCGLVIRMPGQSGSPGRTSVPPSQNSASPYQNQSTSQSSPQSPLRQQQQAREDIFISYFGARLHGGSKCFTIFVPSGCDAQYATSLSYSNIAAPASGASRSSAPSASGFESTVAKRTATSSPDLQFPPTKWSFTLCGWCIISQKCAATPTVITFATNAISHAQHADAG